MLARMPYDTPTASTTGSVRRHPPAGRGATGSALAWARTRARSSGGSTGVAI